MDTRNARCVVTGCVPCDDKCICTLNQFFYMTVDYKGNLVIISDYVKYPKVEVDSSDQLITFHDKDVTDFNKPDTKLFYNGIHKITW